MLTKRQKQILDLVTTYTQKHGYAPSLEEIKKRLKLKSVSTIHEHIATLENKGYLQKQKNQPRSVSALKTGRLVQIPILGRIAAGQPIEVIEEDRETIAISQDLLPKASELYALRVQGDSMIDEGVNDGDTILVKKQNTAENGNKVVALLNGNEATLKTFYKEKGQIRLQPANKKMESLIFKNGRSISIQGIVLDIIGSPSPVAFTKKLHWMK